MTSQPIPVAAARKPTPLTVDGDPPSRCRHCGEPVKMAETLTLYRRGGMIFAVACVPCTHARDRA